MRLFYLTLVLSISTFFTSFSQKISLLKDLNGDNTGTFTSEEQPIVGKIDNTVIIRRQLNSTSFEIWKSDGTSAGTVKLKAITVKTDAIPDNFTLINKTFYFRVATSTAEELWQTDGTATGTVKILENKSTNKLTAFKGNLFYGATTSTETALFKYDIKAKKQEKIYGIDSFYGFADMVAVDTTNLILIAGSTPSGMYVIKSNGTAAGTTNVKLLNNGSAFSQLYLTTVVGKKVFFFYEKPTGTTNAGYFLYATDGTANGTIALKKFQKQSFYSYTEYRATIAYKNKFIFSGNTTTTGGKHSTWASDGTVAGTVLLDPSTTDNLVPLYFTPYNNEVYFMGSILGSYNNVYKTDGTPSGTSLVLKSKDVGSTYLSLGGGNMTLFNKQLYFNVCTDKEGCEVAYSDGTAAGTSIIDFTKGTNNSKFSDFFATDKLLYLTNYSAATGVELFTLDPNASPVGNNDIDVENQKWSYFPNPAQDVLNLDYDLISDVESVIITNMEGKVLIQTKPSNQIDISNLSKGVYIIQLKTQDKLLSKKLVK